MLLVFVALMVFGVASLLVQSLLGGDGDADTEAEPHLDGGGHLDGDSGGDSWLPFASLRFWSFFSAAAGTVGVLGTYLTDVPSWVLAVTALAVGLLVGGGISFTLHRLRADADSGTTLACGRGRVGRVVVPIGAGVPGRVRVELAGRWMDLTASSEAPIEAGAEVVVLDVDGTVATVERAPAEFGRSSG